MQSGQPLNLRYLLPKGVSPEEFYIAVFGILAVVSIAAVMGVFQPRQKMMSRIRAIQGRRRDLQQALSAPRKRAQAPEGSMNFMRKVAMKLQLVKKLEVDRAEGLLIEAGYHSKDAVQIMSFFVMTLPIVLGLLGILLMKVSGLRPESKWYALNYLWPVLGAYIGLKFPWIYVRRKRSKRYLKVQRSLADTLDLMTICAEAGLSLPATLERVSRELAFSYPEMAEELSLTSIEIGFLPDRNKALSNLAERCKLPEIRGIASVLIQTEKYGTPIAQALRVLSSEFRQSRMLRAEQKAAKLPALMTVPMIVFILPTLFIVILSPAIIKLITTTN